jgi:hypothetical protein
MLANGSAHSATRRATAAGRDALRAARSGPPSRGGQVPSQGGCVASWLPDSAHPAWPTSGTNWTGPRSSRV